jgi:hypothetical protein
MRDRSKGNGDAGTLLGVPGHREGTESDAWCCPICGSERAHRVCESDLEGLSPVDGGRGERGGFARAIAEAEALCLASAEADESTHRPERFFVGLAFALILSAPLWAMFAALMGWL